jgi:hypothetical protein
VFGDLDNRTEKNPQWGEKVFLDFSDGREKVLEVAAELFQGDHHLAFHCLGGEL